MCDTEHRWKNKRVSFVLPSEGWIHGIAITTRFHNRNSNTALSAVRKICIADLGYLVLHNSLVSGQWWEKKSRYIKVSTVRRHSLVSCPWWEKMSQYINVSTVRRHSHGGSCTGNVHIENEHQFSVPWSACLARFTPLIDQRKS